MNISLNNLGNANLKTKRKKFGFGSLIFLLLFGAIFVVSGLFIYQGTIIDEDWTRVQGEIVDVSSSINDGSTMYKPVIEYDVNGESYRVTANSSSSAYPNIGDQREVAYNPTQPAEARAVDGDSTKLLILLFPVIGAVMLLLAPFLFVRSLRRSKSINNLMQTGQKLQGVLVDIQSNSGGRNNNTYKIVVSASDSTGAVQNYISDSLTGIGGLAMADFRNTPIPIDVYVDPVNPENYYVDVSDIPNLTPQRISELVNSVINTTQPRSTINPQEQTNNQIPQQPQSPNNPPPGTIN